MPSNRREAERGKVDQDANPAVVVVGAGPAVLKAAALLTPLRLANHPCSSGRDVDVGWKRRNAYAYDQVRPSVQKPSVTNAQLGSGVLIHPWGLGLLATGTLIIGKTPKHSLSDVERHWLPAVNQVVDREVNRMVARCLIEAPRATCLLLRRTTA